MNIIACFYSFENSCILIGELSENILKINEKIDYENKSINQIADILINFKKEIWINKHSGLQIALGNFTNGQLDFSCENELEDLNDLYKSLLAEKRLKKNCSSDGINTEKTLKILLKAFEKKLCSKAPLWLDLFGE